MQVCICTIIKNEQEYLEDWIKYHIDLGIDKMFIVEDIGSESHMSIIEKYSDNVEILNITVDDEIITKEHFKTRQLYLQTAMFKYVKSLDKFDWCFIMDIDEYITITEDISFKNLLEQYNDYSELVIYWKNYGANGYVKKPDYSKVKSYRDYYTKECEYSEMDKKYTFIMKKGINLHKISQNYKVSQHYHSMATYAKTNFQKGIHCPCYDRVYLSHYVTKSWEEYKWKFLVRGMCCKNHRKLDDFFEMNTDMLPLKEKLLSVL